MGTYKNTIWDDLINQKYDMVGVMLYNTFLSIIRCQDIDNSPLKCHLDSIPREARVGILWVLS